MTQTDALMASHSCFFGNYKNVKIPPEIGRYFLIALSFLCDIIVEDIKLHDK